MLTPLEIDTIIMLILLEIVKRNFNFAFSNFEGLVHKDSNIYEMPRFLVRDWDIDSFIQNIKRFFKY